MTEIILNEKRYRPLRPLNGEGDFGLWEFFYKDKWHNMINYNIRFQLCKILRSRSAKETQLTIIY